MKAKVFCLHGKYQSGAVFATKLSRSCLKKTHSVELRTNANFTSLKVVEDTTGNEVDYICIDAPFSEVPKIQLGNLKSNRSSSCDQEFRTWKLDEIQNDQTVVPRIIETLQTGIKAAELESEKEYELCLLGFSQGASVLGMILKGCFGDPIFKPDFSIFLSGYDSASHVAIPDTNERNLHFLSDCDQRVYPNLSRKLHESVGGKLIQHSQGHNIPKDFHQHIFQSLASSSLFTPNLALENAHR